LAGWVLAGEAHAAQAYRGFTIDDSAVHKLPNREAVIAAEGSEFKRSRMVLDGDREKPKALPIGLEKQLGLTVVKASLDELGGTGNAQRLAELHLRG